jgi:Holliday junction resolvase-like predicted endonuclease
MIDNPEDYKEKLKRLFWNIKAIYNLGWGVPVEDRKEYGAVLESAKKYLKDDPDLAEAKRRFDVIVNRNWKGVRLEKLIP